MKAQEKERKKERCFWFELKTLNQTTDFYFFGPYLNRYTICLERAWTRTRFNDLSIARVIKIYVVCK